MASKTPNELAHDYLAASRAQLDAVLTAGTTTALFWAVSDIHHAVEQVLAILNVPADDPDPEALDTLLSETSEEGE